MLHKSVRSFCRTSCLRIQQRRNLHRVCVVGSGPAGFYTAEELLKTKLDVKVDILERLPAPFGLVRYGVAPDHPEVKLVSHKFEEIAQDPRVRYFGNVGVGKDISIEELKQYYDAIVLAYGADDDRRLGVRGEDLRNIHGAKEFVAWYNGLPEHARDAYDLSGSDAVVFGNGNVAVDVARILTKKIEELQPTDITTPSLNVIKTKSNIKRVHIVGRRGPVQAAFTTAEIRELTKLEGVQLRIADSKLDLTEADKEELKARPKKRQFEILQKLLDVKEDQSKLQILLHFLKSPVEFIASETNPTAVGSVRLEHNTLSGDSGAQTATGSGKYEILPCQIAFRSIGYKSRSIPGVPFDAKRGVVPNAQGRVKDGSESILGLYVVGWVKRGPSGIVGTNKVCAEETVASIAADITNGSLKPKNISVDVEHLFKSKSLRYVNFESWKQLDKFEIDAGKAAGKSREKVTSVDEMIDISLR